MRKAEIDALVRAHRGRGRPVAFFHILRQSTLEADDHAFLLEHAAELGASDLLRWRARCDEGFTGPVVRQLARRAVDDPATFRHEVLDLPRIELRDDEWRELAELVRGKVPQAIVDGIVARGGPRPERPPASFYFTPGKLDRSGLDEGANFGPPASRERQPGDARSLGDLFAARRAAGGADPEVDDAALARAAESAATSLDEDWSALVVDFPPALSLAALERARRTPRGAERANLLGWLDTQGVARAELFAVALAPLAPGEPSAGVVAWLAARLGTRASWERHGFDVTTALVGARAFSELGDVVAMVVSDASHGDPARAPAVLDAIQVAFALTLVEATRAAIGARNDGRAAAALSALACLNPPSRISRAVHGLRAAAADAGANADVVELVALNERLVKRGAGRAASLEGLVAALHAVADTFEA